jgi:hypothetical protein
MESPEKPFDIFYDEASFRFMMKWPDGHQFPLSPWERRQGPMPWENCKDEVRHLCKRWGIQKVRGALAKIETGRPKKLNEKAIWLAIELFRHFNRSASITTACNGLSALLKKRRILIDDCMHWPINQSTLRRIHSCVERQTRRDRNSSVRAILHLHISTPHIVVGREHNFEDSLSFALADLRV